MKIGLLGGTFDPVHSGHIALALNALKQKKLDQVWFLVSPDPPHKKASEKSPFSVRYEMTRLALEDYDLLIASDYETKLAQPSYSARTLEALYSDYPNEDFYFIIGEDSLDQIELWYEPEKVLSLAKLLVAVRHEDDGFLGSDKSIDEQIAYLCGKYKRTDGTEAFIEKINCDYVDVSSTEIRQKVKKGESIKGLVPDAVAEYIWKEKLYIK